MAYLPETKDKTARVSPAAQRVLGPEDPRAREEVEARRNQEFGTMDQIGMAADMLPGGAIAAGGAKAAAKKGPDIYKMINDALKGFQRDGDRGAQSAIVNWVSSTDTSIITKAQEYLDSLSSEALKSVEPVRKALNNAYNQFISPKGGHTTQWKDPSAPSAPPKPGSALEYVQQQKKIGKDIEASETTKALVPSQDVDSMVLQFEKIAGSKEVAPEAVTDQLIKATEGDVSKLNAMLKKTEILEEEVFRAGGTHPSDLTIRGLRNLVMALHKAISNVSSHLAPSSSRIKSIPPTSGNRLNLPGGPLYGGPPPPQP